MTHLQQICADMLSSQEQLQILHAAERALLNGRIKNVPGRIAVIRHGVFLNERCVERCSTMLSVNFPAANDEPVPGEAA